MVSAVPSSDAAVMSTPAGEASPGEPSGMPDSAIDEPRSARRALIASAELDQMLVNVKQNVTLSFWDPIHYLSTSQGLP